MSTKIDFLGIVRFRISISLIENDLAALSLSEHDRLLRSQLKQFRQEYHSTFSNKENLSGVHRVISPSRARRNIGFW